MMFCKKCGAEVSEVLQFCPKCGTKIIEEKNAYAPDLEGDFSDLDRWAELAEKGQIQQDMSWAKTAAVKGPVRVPTEDVAAARRDMKRIQKILPASIIKFVLKNGNETSLPYHKVWIKENQSGWLWRATIQVLIPFQMRRGLGGARHMGILNLIYWFFLFFMGWLMFDFRELCNGVFRVIWAVIIVYALLPYGTAMLCLMKNKNIYYRLMR